MMELLTSPQAWIAFGTLTALELVLGIDNVIFISILVDKLPPKQREFARKLGLFLAMFMRIGLLLVLCIATYFAIYLGYGNQLLAMMLFYIVASIWFVLFRYRYVRRGDQFTMPCPKPRGY